MSSQKREQKKEQINGLLQAKQTPSPAAELDLGTLRLDPTVAGTGLRAAVAQVRLLERRPSSRPATPTSNASSTDTPTPSEHNDVEEDLLDVEDEAQGSEPESGPSTLKRPFDLLIAAAMQRNPTQFQLPNDLTCTTALPGRAHTSNVLVTCLYFVFAYRSLKMGNNGSKLHKSTGKRCILQCFHTHVAVQDCF